MPQPAHWPESESEVYPAGNWVLVAVGAHIVLMSGIGFCISLIAEPRDNSLFVLSSMTALFALVGIPIFSKSLRTEFWRRRVRHAAADVLPDVPREPETRDQSSVAGRLLHELIEDAVGWQLRPSERLRQQDRKFLFRVGPPLLLVVAGYLAWAIHSQFPTVDWPAAILFGIAITVFCGGSVLIGTIYFNRVQFGQQSRLTIPNGDGDLELWPPQAAPRTNDNASDRLAIPREKLLAVQLCPWKESTRNKYERGTTWAVQGLLVVAGTEDAPYVRLPMLLSSDMARAACLMQELAEILRVPYLFGGDATGWRLEEQLARHRPPLLCPPLKTPS